MEGDNSLHRVLVFNIIAVCPKTVHRKKNICNAVDREDDSAGFV
jgi:hypothetical protein